jgi:hypothetical protein
VGRHPTSLASCPVPRGRPADSGCGDSGFAPRGRVIRVLLLTLVCLSAAALVRPLAARADVAVQEGTQYSGVVSTVTCGALNPTIDWGDGTSSAGTTVVGPAAPHVNGTHTYRLAGTYSGTVTYTCLSSSGTRQVPFTATVSDAPLTPTGIDFSGSVVTELTPTTAHVDDANPLSVSTDFTATIDWGDGSMSAGTVSAGDGGFDIAGSHAYEEPGSYTVTTSIFDPGGSTTATSTATITGAHTPETTIDSGPAGTINTATPTFTFSSDASGATFECSLDGGPYSACATPLTIGPLSDGAHTFAVRAVASGRTDPTPATQTFTVDTGPPDTTIDSGPSGVTNSPTPQFTFSSNRADSTFECSVDGAPFTACTTPLTTATLADGSHQVEVRAVEGGQTDPTPATQTFTVDTTPPDTTIVSGPADGAGVEPADPPPVYGFVSSEPGSTFLCRTYPEGSAAGAFVACATPSAAAPTGQGTWRFEVAAVDPAGNVDPTPAARTFTNLAPDTIITSGPMGNTWKAEPQYTFTSTIPGSTFVCRVDGGPGSACSSPRAIGPFAAGSTHTFSVQAKSPAGVLDPTPAVATVSINATQVSPHRCEITPFLKTDPYDESHQSVCAFFFDNPVSCANLKEFVCVEPPDTCPAQATCTLNTKATWSDGDNNVPWFVQANSEVLGPAGSALGQYIHSCTVADGQPGCTVQNQESLLGPAIFDGLCQAVPPDGGQYGSADDRDLVCTSTVTITPARPLFSVSVLSGIQIFAPGAGTFVFTPAARATPAVRTLATTKHVATVFKTTTTKVSAAGAVDFEPKLRADARASFKRHHKLAIEIRVKFVPSHGGTTLTRTIKTTLTTAAKRPPRCPPHPPHHQVKKELVCLPAGAP